MYRLAYSIPFSKLILLIFVFCGIWCFVKDRLSSQKAQIWKGLQFGMLAVCVGLFLSVSLVGRASVPEQQWPQVFWSYRLALEGSYDHFQEIYLNVLAFLFISLFAAELAPSSAGKLMVLCICAALSVFVESLQFFFSVGLAEADDIISNVLGSILGMLVNIYGYRLYQITVRVMKRWIIRKH